MIRKSKYIISAWIALMLMKYGESGEFAWKDVLFTREEILDEARKYLPGNKTVSNADFAALMQGRGVGDTKWFVPGNAGTLQEYVYLLPSVSGGADVWEPYIDIIHNVSPAVRDHFTPEEIRAALETYLSFVRRYRPPEQRLYPDLMARDALWLAMAALTYNDWVRGAGRDENDNLWYRQSTIAAVAFSFNPENSLDTCRQMARKDCTAGQSSQGYTYFTAEDKLRRLTRANEQLNAVPDISGEYEVVVIDGIRSSGYLRDFVQTVYSEDAGDIQESQAWEASGESQREQASALSDRALYQAALQRSQWKVPPRTAEVNQYYRDPYISLYAKRRAQGKCQLCGNEAPFTGTDGEPYLEAHHIQWLSEGGRDALDNVAALCPNCHRKMHQLNLPEDREKLYREINA